MTSGASSITRIFIPVASEGPAAGTIRRKTLPRPSSDSTSTRPPCAWAVISTIGRPRPLPPGRAIRSAHEEALEEKGPVVLRDAVPVVGHLPADVVSDATDGQSDLAARLRELVRVGYQVQDGPLDSPMVREDPYRLRHRPRESSAGPSHRARGASASRTSSPSSPGVEAAQLKPDLASAEARQLERRVRQPLQLLRIPLDGLQQLSSLIGRGARLWIEQQPHRGANRGQRRAQLVGDRREEIAAQPLELGQMVLQFAALNDRVRPPSDHRAASGCSAAISPPR